MWSLSFFRHPLKFDPPAYLETSAPLQAKRGMTLQITGFLL